MGGLEAALQDTDGDGLAHILDDDADGDGVLDRDEVRPGDDVDGDGAINMLDSDSDGDGADDASEIQLGTNPVLSDLRAPELCDPATGCVPATGDLDGDGIGTLNELQGIACAWQGQPAATSPTLADTDGDGLDDGAECALGLNPADKDTDDDGLADGLRSRS